MSGGAAQLHPLKHAQRDAARPDALVWLSASAGTGKTHVLSARVFRLLLRGDVEPENILCLTFTKAGAAEMANRINSRLAAWVRMEPSRLASELAAIGLEVSRFDLDPARQLFAKMLDAPGGGLRIMTIHSFCQQLLASFPLEAGLLPGFTPIEERDQALLLRDALADLLLVAESDGRDWLIGMLQDLSRDLGEDRVLSFLRRCTSASDVLSRIEPGSGISTARRLAGVEIEGEVADFLTEACSDAAFPVDCLREVAALNEEWGSKRGVAHVETIRTWLAADAGERGRSLRLLHKVWCTGKGTLPGKGYRPPDESADAPYERMFGHVQDLLDQCSRAEWAERYGRALEVGRAFAAHYALIKRTRGLVDFDDLIRMAAHLLASPRIGEWIRYKLDQRIDHILVDEAQDTNDAQWNIVAALTEEFFAGEGAQDGSLRTLFTVGDFKQAIFGFQGTSPQSYEKARAAFLERASSGGRDFDVLDLSHSFRSTRPVLSFVDRALEVLGPDQLGLRTLPPPHSPVRGDEGQVQILPPVRASNVAAEADGEEQWLPDEKLVLAERIAAQVRHWIEDGEPLASGERPQPGDIMILVRSRTELSRLIVARLHAEGIAVAGIDRIRLSQPLPVLDLMAAIRFVLQPDDDLNLASLLVSPLIGWTHDELHLRGWRDPAERKRRSLWRHLREQTALAEMIAPLRDLLDRADFGTPYQFLEHILSGPMAGRRRFEARMGYEVRDPIAELLNAAQQFEMSNPPSLQTFLRWFEGSDVEIKREGGQRRNEVRVLTVHGAKGLEAPIVLLADATFDPAKKGDGSFDQPVEDSANLPFLPIRKAERSGPLAALADVAEAREKEEHWRLFYVAATRAQERLAVAGALGVRAREVPEQSWHALAQNTVESLGGEERADPLWGGLLEYRLCPAMEAAANAGAKTESTREAENDLPQWLTRPLAEERRPPRPLSPSDPGDVEPGLEPAAGEAMRRAARRGSLLHALFERLPDAMPEKPVEAIARWLAVQAPELDAGERVEIAQSALNIVQSPRWTDLFGTDSLPEVPVAAVVGETVVAGKIDRLRVGPDLVEAVDFKTGRQVPDTVERVPAGHLKQMAWYVAALRKIYPDRQVKAALLYTAGPTLIDIPDAMLAPLVPDDPDKPD